MADREQKTRERAHQIWEEEGRPEGREQEHWERATREIDSEDRVSEPFEGGEPDNQQEHPSGGVGAASGLQPDGSTGGVPTGSPKKAGRKRR